jgi:hypothetical protein
MGSDLAGHTPVVILGAGRSGTNILRDVLSASDLITTWPCDEINYIWRHGNARVAHDAFTADMASPRIGRYIAGAFNKQAARGDATTVLEKTCASSLRVPFIREVMPTARFVVIERDPIDVVASAMKRWRGELDSAYIASKARFVPLLDLPYYGSRYLWHRVRKARSADGTLPSWGPRFPGIDEAVATEPLHVVCARQWAACVSSTRAALAADQTAVAHSIRYEELATAPAAVISRVSTFVLGEVRADVVAAAESSLSPSSIGRGRSELSDAEVRDVEAIVREVVG